jgi:hypothetical protein
MILTCDFILDDDFYDFIIRIFVLFYIIMTWLSRYTLRLSYNVPDDEG